MRILGHCYGKCKDIMYILCRSIGDPEFTFGRVLASEIASTTTSVSLFLILFHLCPLEAASSTLSVRRASSS